MNFYIEKKQMYMKTIYNCVAPMLYDGLNSMYEVAKTNGSDALKNFQILLRDIPNWDKKIIEEETDRILKDSECMYLDNLLKAIIKTNVIIMAANDSNISENNKKYKILAEKIIIDIPFFIHNCYIECAKKIDDEPFLFYDNIDPIQIKKNQKEIKIIIIDAIDSSIQKMLPVELLLQEYLNDVSTMKDNQNITNDNIIKSNNQNQIELNIKNTPDDDLDNSTLLLLNALKTTILSDNKSLEKKKESINNKSIDNKKTSINDMKKEITNNEVINEHKKESTNNEVINENKKELPNNDKNDKKDDTEAPYYLDDNGNYEAEFSNQRRQQDKENRKRMYFGNYSKI